MPKKILGWLAIVLVGAGSLAAGLQSSSPVPSPASSKRELLDRYCVTCHNEQLRTAGLVLSKLDIDKVSEDRAVWEKVLGKLRAGAMPPSGMPRPDQPTLDAFLTYLKTELDGSDTANPGNFPARRLNRTEYTNAIRDLLGIRIDGRALLPADDSRHGFDNVADALTVSPSLLERYLSAARKIRRLALGDPTVSPVFETYNLPRYLMQDERISENLPFGSRGGIAIHHHFPLDGEYVIKVRLQTNSRGYIRGLGEPHQLDVLLDGARIKRFTIGGEHRGESASIFSNAQFGDPAQEVYERTADEILEVRFRAGTGRRLVGIAFQKDNWAPEGPSRQRMAQYDFTQYKGGLPAVGNVTISGPYVPEGLGETPARRRIFVCRPSASEEEEPCAEEILSALARRAYRRPLMDEDCTSSAKVRHFESSAKRQCEPMLIGLV